MRWKTGGQQSIFAGRIKKTMPNWAWPESIRTREKNGVGVRDLRKIRCEPARLGLGWMAVASDKRCHKSMV